MVHPAEEGAAAPLSHPFKSAYTNGRNSTGPLSDQLIMLDPPVLGEIEHRFLVVAADLQIAFRQKHLVAIARRLRDDFA